VALLLSGGWGGADALTLVVPESTVAPGAPIVIRLDRAPGPADGTLAVLIGTLDVTTLFRLAGNELLFTGKEFALPAGEFPLVVWQVQGGAWREIHRSTLKIAAEMPSAVAADGERKRFTPTLDVSIKAQVRERVHGNGARSARPTFSDIAMRGAVAVDDAIGSVNAKGNANIVGTSYRGEALQFGTRAAQAAKVDLADYRFDFGYGPTQLSVGHIGWGNHPLLLNSYNSRGLIGTVKLGQRFDVSLNAMNGTSVVGFDNFFGMAESRHRIHGAQIGVEADPAQPGWLRAELSFVDASMLARSNFNRGEIPDAEKSTGFGARLLGRLFGGRLRTDLAFARNEYRPADDPQLSQGQRLTPLSATTRGARIIDAAFDLVQGWELAEGLTLTLTPVLRYEQVQPLYKMLGASINADQRVRRAGVTGRFGALQAHWSRSQREDNLDRIVSLLKTRTESDEAALSVPLAELLRAKSATNSIWPRLSLQWQDNRQFAVNSPDFALSGIQPSHRPDQANRTASAAAAWSLGRYGINYSVNHARQDNRQPGRENADFLNLGHQLSLSVAWSETLNLNAGANRTRQFSTEKQLAGYVDGATFGLEWHPRDHWTISGNYALTRGDDSRDLALSRGHTLQTQLARRFTLPGLFGAPMQGQAFVRHALQSTSNTDRSLGLQASGRSWTINLGASLSLF
jgi:hypothetical protein